MIKTTDFDGFANVLLDKCNSDLSLNKGLAGDLLWMFYYLQVYDNKEVEFFFKNNAQRLLEGVNDHPWSYFDGRLGIGAIINLFIDTGIFDVDCEVFLKEIDTEVNNLVGLRKLRQMDFAEGYLGAGCFILQRVNADILESNNIIVQINFRENLIVVIDLLDSEDGLSQLSEIDLIRSLYFVEGVKKLKIYPEICNKVLNRIIEKLESVKVDDCLTFFIRTELAVFKQEFIPSYINPMKVDFKNDLIANCLAFNLKDLIQPTDQIILLNQILNEFSNESEGMSSCKGGTKALALALLCEQNPELDSYWKNIFLR